jgi:ATP synthase protein I
MTEHDRDDEFAREVERKAERIRRARSHKSTLIANTVFAGTLGLVFILPVVGGAFLGRWIDDLAAGYSVRWTVSLILLGIGVGAMNVYWLIKE